MIEKGSREDIFCVEEGLLNAGGWFSKESPLGLGEEVGSDGSEVSMGEAEGKIYVTNFFKM